VTGAEPQDFTAGADTQPLGDRPSSAVTAGSTELFGRQLRDLPGRLVSSVPLTVEPSLWNRGVARALLVEAMAIFDRREVRHPGSSLAR